MHLGSVELQIFVALVLVLGSAFVALICDFLKGNNEQLRERNIELRVRQDERERMGLFEPLAHPIAWLQGLTALARNPSLAEAVAGAATQQSPAASQAAEYEASTAQEAAGQPPPPSQPDLDNLTSGSSVSEADRNPARRHRYDEFKATAKQQSWATKEELEQLAGRAARIRARHEASQRKVEEPHVAAAEIKEAPRRPSKVAELPKLETLSGLMPVQAPTPVEEAEAAAAQEVEVTIEIAEPRPVVAIVEEQAPAAVAETSAPSAWVFRPAEPETLATESTPEVAEEEIPAAIVEAQPEQPPPPPVSDPVIDIWRRPMAAAETATPPPVPHHEPIRTRIQPVEVTPLEDAITEQFPPPADIRQPEPALDVVALQKAMSESAPAPVRPVAMEPVAEAKLEIPAGLHEAAVLSQLLENQAPYTGVVVAIGLNDYETLREKLASGTDSVAALNKMVLSMLRPQDFACRFQDDEYILIYPGERGSSAQRRLFQVSEKLWDFQLRSLGNLSVMFSWGGLEVTNETLAEAVASARERMYQTKRNRKPSGLEFAVGRKKVVNG